MFGLCVWVGTFVCLGCCSCVVGLVKMCVWVGAVVCVLSWYSCVFDLVNLCVWVGEGVCLG